MSKYNYVSSFTQAIYAMAFVWLFNMQAGSATLDLLSFGMSNARQRGRRRSLPRARDNMSQILLDSHMRRGSFFLRLNGVRPPSGRAGRLTCRCVAAL